MQVKDRLRVMVSRLIRRSLVDSVLRFHDAHAEEICTARGSSSNHQSWFGGYHDHIVMCLELAERQFKGLNSYINYDKPGYAPRKFDLGFTLENAALVLYFHDIEKIFKYGGRQSFYTKKLLTDKDIWFQGILPIKYNIEFDQNELNALDYVHGEHDYAKDERKMRPLAAFCHCIDIQSARIFHDVSVLRHQEDVISETG